LRVSTRVEYGVMALVDITLQNRSGTSVTALEIAERQGISKKYLEQILPLLKQAGIIRAQKGIRGGTLFPWHHQILELAIYQLMVDIYKFPKLFMLRSFNGISLMPLPDLIQATLSLMTFSFSLTERSLYPPTFMI